MRIKKANLNWKVLGYDFNTNTTKAFNIFHSDFAERLAKAIKKGEIKRTSDLKEYIRRETFYYYHSRVEYEALIGWAGEKDINKCTKVSIVYDQIIANLDLITNYVVNQMKIDFKNKEVDDEDE